MKASAIEMQTKNRVQRIQAGSKGEGPGVVRRSDLVQSTAVMIKNSRIATIAPAAALTLGGIRRIVDGGTGDMTKEEYLEVADRYDVAREDLRRAFEDMSKEAQVEGMGIVRKLRAEDEERMRKQTNQS